jgi:hypothetical protein
LSAPFNAHKHAPAPPDANITALVQNLAGVFQGGQWQAQFLSCSNWLYNLQRSSDLQNWTDIVSRIPGNNTNLILSDTNPPLGKAFYRVGADVP